MQRTVRLCLVALLVSILLLVGPLLLAAQSPQDKPPSRDDTSAAPAVDPSQLAKIDPGLLQALQRDESRQIDVIVEMKPVGAPLPEVGTLDQAQQRQAVVDSLQVTAQQSQQAAQFLLLQQVQAGHAGDVRAFWIFNGLAASLDYQATIQLASLEDVFFIRAENTYQLEPPPIESEDEPQLGDSVEWNIARIRADLAWDALRITGAGVVVANIDTGVDWLHPALRTRYRGYDPNGLYNHQCNWFDATGQGAVYPVDYNGHGTHTMGTAVGANGIGVAPEATWIAVRAFDNQGSAAESWLHAAFQWILDPGPGCTPPDIVSNSWSSSLGGTEAFRPDVSALQAAGIFAPFAAGNNGPSPSSVGAPASYPEAFAVGSIASNDAVANSSGRGPSIWFDGILTKPDIAAPGVNVLSSLPGGTYGLASGTSMATPHVAGVAALILQAKPDASISQIETVMKQTAYPLGNPIPNNDSGWGRLDAYASLVSILDAGVLSGTVTDAGSGSPLAGARIAATPFFTGSATIVTTDAQGDYAVSLAPDSYLVTASTFGYASSSRPTDILSGATTVENFALQPLPSGTLRGQVLGGGQIIQSQPGPTVTVEGTSLATTVDAGGWYSMSVPAGSYTVTARTLGYRVGSTTGVVITAGQTTSLNFDLSPSPTILLVDSGDWYQASQIAYYRQALDAIQYTYDVWTIRDAIGGVPTADDLRAYDIVFWSSPFDSPGYVGAGGAISGYLDDGGNLFLSGQNVAFYDDFYRDIYTAYLQDYLKVSYVRNGTGIFHLQGFSPGLFEGLDVTISGSGGANNQVSQDEIAIASTDFAAPLLTYEGDGLGGQQTGGCLPYRTIFLSFGFEAITSQTVRTEVFSRSIAFFTAGPETSGVTVSPITSTRVADFGAVATHTLRVRNLAETGEPDTVSLEVQPHLWNTSLASQTLVLSPCAAAKVAVTVQVPATAAWSSTDTAVVTATAQHNPGSVVTAALRTEAPAPVLLVDDDRFYEVEGHYRQALEANGIPYQEWSVASSYTGTVPPSPPPDVLAMYPMVLWASAYDWFQPLTPIEEERLSAYLVAGGALFYNGQDYLYATEGPDDFARDYLGVAAYTEDFTSTLVTGVITSPVGSWLGPSQLTYPYRNYSDALTPTTTASPAFVGQAGQVNSLTNQGDTWRTSFFAFDPDGLPSDTTHRLVARLVGWLSWMGGSSVTADRSMARAGDTLTYTVELKNDGQEAIERAVMTATFPINLTPVPASIQGGAAWNSGLGVFSWSGNLALGQSRIFTYQAFIDNSLSGAQVISHTVWMGYDSHSVYFDRIASTYVNYPLLTQSSFQVTPANVSEGEWLTYTLRLRNTGYGAAQATAGNQLPLYLQVDETSIRVSQGSVQHTAGELHWSADVPESSTAVMTYTGVLTGIPANFRLVNPVSLSDGLGNQLHLQAVAQINGIGYFLPSVFKDASVQD